MKEVKRMEDLFPETDRFLSSRRERHGNSIPEAKGDVSLNAFD
jgi:hypothetical protein